MFRYLDYTFFSPGEPNWSDTIPTQEPWDDMKYTCFDMNPGDACAHCTSLIHAGNGNVGSVPKYALFLAWPTDYSSFEANTDEVVVFYDNWLKLKSDM